MPMLELTSGGVYFSVVGEGTPIVFIHPPLISSTIFRCQMEELSKKYKVITFDVRGHGRSPSSSEPITYKLISDDMKQLLEHLSLQKAFLCGYSTGGSVVLDCLLTKSKWALGGIVVSGMSEVSDFYNAKRIALAKFLSKTKGLWILTFAISLGNSNSKELFKDLYYEARKGDAENIEQYFRCSLEYNCTNQLNEIESPMLLVYGSQDKPFQKYAKLLHLTLPHNELRFIQERHQIPTKSAKELNHLIDQFISENT